MSDLRVLAALADGLGISLGFRTPAAGARPSCEELGAWEGARAAAPAIEPGQAGAPGVTAQAVLATWRLHLDDSSALADEPYLLDDRPTAGGPGSARETRRGRPEVATASSSPTTAVR